MWSIYGRGGRKREGGVSDATGGCSLATRRRDADVAATARRLWAARSGCDGWRGLRAYKADGMARAKWRFIGEAMQAHVTG